MKDLPGKLTSIFDGIINSLTYTTYILWAFAWLSVTFQIVMRYFLKMPQVWVIEITEYTLFFGAFLPAAWILKRDGHVKVDIVINHLSPKTKSLLNIITSLLGATACLVLAIYSAEITWDHFLRGVHIQKMMNLPKAPMLAIIPLCSFLLTIQFLRRANSYYSNWKKSS